MKVSPQSCPRRIPTGQPMPPAFFSSVSSALSSSSPAAVTSRPRPRDRGRARAPHSHGDRAFEERRVVEGQRVPRHALRRAWFRKPLVRDDHGVSGGRGPHRGPRRHDRRGPFYLRQHLLDRRGLRDAHAPRHDLLPARLRRFDTTLDDRRPARAPRTRAVVMATTASSYPPVAMGRAAPPHSAPTSTCIPET